eukprot:TRINITY_DN1615_c0_g1_i1.p1 TRINITY_DN1615_c0_g1~~TRINITY_DN1615_c0_g1_i1.p1  ORF type:complete len:436 (-),score=163.49 TRINITY_DN1615_c0_g1_i1:144-1415(-)
MESANRRLAKISTQLQTAEPSSTIPRYVQPNQTAGGAVGQKDPRDPVIVCAIRTPITKAKRGPLRETKWTELLTLTFKGLIEKSKINPQLVDDVCVGTVLTPGGGGVQSRMAIFLAGLAEKTSVSTTNRQCASGLQALANIAGAIRNGYIEVGIAAGCETMSQYSVTDGVEVDDFMMGHPSSQACLVPMGETSENVASKYSISREEQDKFALASQTKALAAQKAGKFKEEIVPITVSLGGKKVTVSEDDGIRPTTLEGLAKLKPAFKATGSTTAGNASQVSDGAGAVLVMSRAKAQELGYPVLGVFRSFATVGVPPEIMGVGPGYAIPEAVKRAGLQINDIDIFEVNEAFASQALWSLKHAGIPVEKVNPNGGAIALGHPLGATGARQVSTLLNEMKRQNKRFGVISMCIGTGMGAAAVFERE